MNGPRITNVSNIAAFGAEWEDGETTYQLVSSRGSWDLTFGSKGKDAPKWGHHGLVVRPERFGFTSPPTSWREFLPIAEAFVKAGTAEES